MKNETGMGQAIFAHQHGLIVVQTNLRMKTLPTMIFAVYLLILIKLILFKGTVFYHIVPTSEGYIKKSADSSLIAVNITPLATIKGYLNHETSVRAKFFNVFGNILLFIPYGFLLPLLFKRRIILFDAFYTAAILSFCFELLQLITRTGQFDIDDIILNTLGGVIGYLFFMLFERILEAKQYQKQYLRKRRN